MQTIDRRRTWACLDLPPKSTDTNQMNYYLPEELILISCRYRTDSCSPRKTVLSLFLENNEHALGLFFFFRRTERPDRTNGHKWRLVWMELGIYYCRCRWTRTAHQHAVGASWHALKVIVRTDLAGEAIKILDEPKHGFLPRNGTNSHE